MATRSFLQRKVESLLVAVAVVLPAIAMAVHFGLLPNMWR